MAHGRSAERLRWRRWSLVGLLWALSACSVLPRELNFSPIYYHRQDKDGSLRELDVFWPLIHYEKTEAGGDDFRIRPFWRRVTEPDLPAVEHQFLWPLGRVRTDDEETRARLFPVWDYRHRKNQDGLDDVDWNLLLLLWGGRSTPSPGAEPENYFAFLPFWADIPGFLTYDRFRTVMFPLYVGLEKGTRKEDIYLWPFFGVGGDARGEPRHSWRALPFYGTNVHEGRYERNTALWPFIHWGTENLDTDDPIDRYFLFPVWGQQTSEKVDSWTALWPFFQKLEIRDRLYRLDLLWPIFRYHRDDGEFSRLYQWWVWPFVSRTETDDQRAWSFLWPLMWFREYDDPEGRQTQDWVLPFYWHIHRDRDDGTEDDFLKIWPLFHTEHRDAAADGTPNGRETGGWAFPSPLPWHHGLSYGVREAYGWLWTLAEHKYGPERDETELAAKVFTTAKRDGLRQTSVPLLFNYEADDNGERILRLFQFFPIRLGSAAPAGDPQAEDR